MVHENLVKLRDLFPKMSRFYLKITNLRDKYIAHLDKKRLLYEIESHQTLRVEEIRQAYQDIGFLINEILFDTSINPDLLNYEQLAHITGELNKYLTICRRGFCSKQTIR